MKMSRLTGWKDVYLFTLKQTLKSKAFRIFFIIFLLIAVLSIPVTALFSKQETNESKNHITTLYVADETKLSSEGFLPNITGELFKDIKIVKMTNPLEKQEQKLDKEEGNAVILHITKNDSYGIQFQFIRAKDTDVTKGELEHLMEELTVQFDNYRVEALQLSKEQQKLIKTEFKTNVTKVDKTGNEIKEEDTRIDENQYWISYAVVMLMMMTLNISCSLIASEIANEKSGRVIEYLLTSIRPLALMVGKILAMLTVVLIQILVLIMGVILSDRITSTILSTESLMEQYVPKEVVTNLQIGNVVAGLLAILLGLTFYGILAGLAGATISRMEELKEGMTLFMTVMIIGVYIAFFAQGLLMGAGENFFVTFAIVFPLSSPFMLPSVLMIGKVSALTAIGSILLLIVAIILLFQFTARVYEALILYNGTRIKVKQLFKLSRAVRKGEKQNVS